MQDQRQVGYVFAGSEPSLMERMLSPQRPFYKAGPVMRLEKIAGDHLRATSSSTRFTASGIKRGTGPRRGDRRLGRQRPLRRPAPGARDLGRCAVGGARRVGLEDLHATLTRLLAEQHTLFEESWQRLTLAQRAVLRALVLERDASCCLRRFARVTACGPSSVQPSLAALVRQDLVMRDDNRYVVSDSLFREWVARQTF